MDHTVLSVTQQVKLSMNCDRSTLDTTYKHVTWPTISQHQLPVCCLTGRVQSIKQMSSTSSLLDAEFHVYLPTLHKQHITGCCEHAVNKTKYFRIRSTERVKKYFNRTEQKTNYFRAFVVKLASKLIDRNFSSLQLLPCTVGLTNNCLAHDAMLKTSLRLKVCNINAVYLCTTEMANTKIRTLNWSNFIFI